MDNCGNFYVSAWSSNSLHKYNPDFSQTEIIASGLNNPADICYNEDNNIIAVPNSGNNTVDFINYNCNNTTISEIPEQKKIIQITDLLGRKNKNKGFKLHIYDDGTVEKKYLIK